MNLRRFGPLLGALAACVLLLLARLYDVQLVEHDVWAREAAALVRSWTVEPYRRGTLYDRQGREIVRDEEVYELDFVWRDFRRGHPLGQVAQLGSLIGMRSISLPEAREHLLEWGEAFLRLSPADIDAFGRGEQVLIGSRRIPGVEGATRRERRRQARDQRRGSRARDLHFYVKALLAALLDLDRGTLRDLERRRKQAARAKSSYMALTADLLGLRTPDLRARLESELRGSLEHLGNLAALIDWGDVRVTGSTDLGRLVALIERKRRQVESATADELFRRATGFDPSRLDRANLSRMDLEWLRTALHWDAGRMQAWVEGRGGAFVRQVHAYLAGHAVARAKLASGTYSGADAVLSSLAMFFNGDLERRTLESSAVPVHWSRASRLVALDGLAGRFQGARELPRDLGAQVLAVQRPALRRARGLTGVELLRAALGEVAFPDPEGGLAEGAARDRQLASLLAAARPARRTWDVDDEAAFAAVLVDWDRRLQAAVAAAFDALGEGGGRARLTEADVGQAVEQRAYVVRDRGARPVRFDRRPPYDLVFLVARHPGRFAGFHVRSTTRRKSVALLDPDDPTSPLVARPLVGAVRSPYLVSLLEQRPKEIGLRELQSRPERSDEEREEILAFVEATRRQGEAMGSHGLEGYFDRELSGSNGYRETVGLQERRERRRAPIDQPPVDGHDLVLTLDLDLQRAAQALIDRPGPPPPGEERPDLVWHAYPVGAIVLVTVEGRVLAAASGPSRPRGRPGPYQDDQGRFASERTLRQATFQPPGSVLKPFVAAFALERGWIDLDGFAVRCAARDGESLGSHRSGATVHCHRTHGELRLVDALKLSCNAFFAALGELHYDGETYRAMARSFGFDRPTGVRCLQGVGRREGLFEDARSGDVFESESSVPSGPMLERLGNGLTHISVTPMQVARAFCALATGRLPELALVERIGGREVLPRSRPLEVGEAALETVRSALRQVPLVGTARGTGLDPQTLGFTFACKTGSADVRRGRVPEDPRLPRGPWVEGMRKHGWVAGWFPAEDPLAVAVVYVHNTTTTSRHVATHVMSRFLRSEALAAWLEEAR